MEFIFPIFPVWVHGVYTPRYEVVELILSIFPVRDCGVYSVVNRETFLELRSKLRSNALSVTAIDFSGI